MFVRRILLCFMLVLAGVALGNTLPDDFMDKLKKVLFEFSQEHPYTSLYVHIDKNVYMPGEYIWFKAYFPSSSNIPNEALYLRLIDDQQKIIIEKEFLAYDIRANGQIILPDTLKPGKYRLYAYTDKMMNFDLHDVFIQEIKVVSNVDDRLNATAQIIDTSSLYPGKSVSVNYEVTSHDRLPITAKGTYTLVTSNNETISSGKIRTDAYGKGSFSFIYPSVDSLCSITLKACFFRDSSKACLSLILPPRNRNISLKVTAEGGRLIQGVNTKILTEAFDATGNPCLASVSLLDDDQIRSTLTTNAEGRAIFWIKPQAQHHYQFVIRHGKTLQTGKFPLEVIPVGWTLKLSSLEKKTVAVVYNQHMAEKATLVLRSMHDMLWHQSISIKSGDSLVVPLPNVDSVKQLLSIALFDAENKLSNERLFLTRKTENYRVAFQFDKPSYGKRNKVHLMIKITDNNGMPVLGNISIAAISKSVLDESRYKTIIKNQYASLNSPDKSYLNYNDNEADFNDALISRNWWHNSWREIYDYPAIGKISLMKNSAGITGSIKRIHNKQIKLSQLILRGSYGFRIVNILPNGSFSISPTELLSDSDKKNYIIFPDDNANKYTIELNNYDILADNKIKALGWFNGLTEFMIKSKPSERSFILGKNMLKEVRIVSYSEKMSPAALQKLIDNYPATCLDYVCIYNYLNCPVHPDGIKPVIGKVYNIDGEPRLYTRCIRCSTPIPNSSILLRNIDQPIVFPELNYDVTSASSEQFESTIYWNPNVSTNKSGEATMEFHTSDLSGDYKIIVQGIENNSLKPIFGDVEFTVK